MARFTAEYGREYGEAEAGTLDCDFKAVAAALYNLPFDQSAEEVTRIFKDNIAKLREYLNRIDILGEDLGLDAKVAENKSPAVSKLETTLNSYTELATLQGEALRKVCALLRGESGNGSYTPFSELE